MERKSFLQMMAICLMLGMLSVGIVSCNDDDEASPVPDNSSAPKTFTVGDVSFKMIPVEGTMFRMGATWEQGSEAMDREKPEHTVTLSSYYIGETEVTQALWKAVMGTNPSEHQGDNLPVEMVSWEDCLDFIDKLNEKTGQTFRMPTEAEWEHAARKGGSYKYSGSDNIGDVAWFGANSEGHSHEVKTKGCNGLGLYDMSGNVWEWCHDFYGPYTSEAQTNPTGPAMGQFRVFRGGSWNTAYMGCRVSYREDGMTETSRQNNIGLRLAL